MPDVQRNMCRSDKPWQHPRAVGRGHPQRLERTLRVAGQPLNVLLVEQTAYFRLVRKHGTLLSSRRHVHGGVGSWSSSSGRAFSFREGSCFVAARRGAGVTAGELEDADGLSACRARKAKLSETCGLQRALRAASVTPRQEARSRNDSCLSCWTSDLLSELPAVDAARGSLRFYQQGGGVSKIRIGIRDVPSE
jgi:hypothetical protein